MLTLARHFHFLNLVKKESAIQCSASSTLSSPKRDCWLATCARSTFSSLVLTSPLGYFDGNVLGAHSLWSGLTERQTIPTNSARSCSASDSNIHILRFAGLRGGGVIHWWLTLRLTLQHWGAEDAGTSERTLEGHIQESTCFLHSLTLAPVTGDRIEGLVELAPAVFREASPTAPTSTDSRQVTLAHPGREISLPPLRRGKNMKVLSLCCSLLYPLESSCHHVYRQPAPNTLNLESYSWGSVGDCRGFLWLRLILKVFSCGGSCVSSISCIYNFMDARHYTQTRVWSWLCCLMGLVAWFLSLQFDILTVAKKKKRLYSYWGSVELRHSQFTSSKFQVQNSEFLRS